MLPEVLNDVDDRGARLARCAQRAGVVAVTPDAAATRGRAIDGSGTAPGETLKPTGQGLPRIRFDDEVDVIRLNGEMDDTKVAAIGMRQCSSQL